MTATQRSLESDSPIHDATAMQPIYHPEPLSLIPHSGLSGVGILLGGAVVVRWSSCLPVRLARVGCPTGAFALATCLSTTQVEHNRGGLVRAIKIRHCELRWNPPAL